MLSLIEVPAATPATSVVVLLNIYNSKEEVMGFSQACLFFLTDYLKALSLITKSGRVNILLIN